MLKSFPFAIVLSFLVFACNKAEDKNQKTEPASNDSIAIAAALKDTANMAKFQFEEKEFNFGDIHEGDIVKHVFKFTNIGKSDLLISDAKGSCGCTIPSFPKEPIAPGANGEIEVQFNSKNKSGQNLKHVSIMANTYPEVTSLNIRVNVLKVDETKGPIAD